MAFVTTSSSEQNTIKILVRVKRVVSANVKVLVKGDGSAVELANSRARSPIQTCVPDIEREVAASIGLRAASRNRSAPVRVYRFPVCNGRDPP